MTTNLNRVDEQGPTFPSRTFVDHIVTGTEAELSAIWANHRRAGTLITYLQPQPLDDGRYQMMFRLRTAQQAQPANRLTATQRVATPPSTPSAPVTNRRPSRRISRTAIAAIGIVSGVAAVAAYLLGQLVELIAAHAGLILGVLALAAILATAAARRSSSGRRHCPGC